LSPKRPAVISVLLLSYVANVVGLGRKREQQPIRLLESKQICKDYSQYY
jgi:hypothetical protein